MTTTTWSPLEHALVTQGLQVNHLRLVIGHLHGLHAFLAVGRAYPNFMDALMPLACLPVQIAGRNRVWRKLSSTRSATIRSGSAANTTRAAGGAAHGRGLPRHRRQRAASVPEELPTRDAADAYVDQTINRDLATLDANDFLYQVDSSRNYDPSVKLADIKAPVMWVNSADDFINPPELGIAEREIKRVKNGRFVLLPASNQTHGHGTHTWAAVWQQYLGELLVSSAPKTGG